jgi:hypothetical protein
MTRSPRCFSMILVALLTVGAAAQQNSIQAVPEQQVSAAPHAVLETARPDPDPLLDVPALPKGQVSLIGGTVRSVDRVRQRLVVHAFGGKNMKVSFDDRTHIYRDGTESTMLALHKGDRVYVDTMLDRGGVFAKNIRVETQGAIADAHGQLISYDPHSGQMSLRDELSARAVSLKVAPTTRVLEQGRPGSASDLKPGSLVSVVFVNGKSDQNQAREITVLASPGAAFTFAGKVTHLNLSDGTLAVRNEVDNQTYDINFPRQIASANLGVGSDVTVNAVFDGKGYTARAIQVNRR